MITLPQMDLFSVSGRRQFAARLKQGTETGQL